jgi:hypothetical protein
MSALSPNRKKKFFFWSGVLIIAVLYCLYYVFFLYGVALIMPLRGRHILKFVFTFSVYVVGAICLRGFAVAWMRRVWRWTYLLILVLLVALGGYDWLVARTPLEIRSLADNLQEFLVSPLLYVAMGILGKRLAT